MATPIGHGLAGYAVGKAFAFDHQDSEKWVLGFCILLAIAPDLDFLPGILEGQPALYHQGVSHSLFVGAAAGWLAALVTRSAMKWSRALWKDGLAFSLAYWSHLFMDLFGPDKREPIGIPLFWPLSDATFLAPYPILWGVHHARSTSTTTGDWVWNILDIYNLGAIGIEILFVAPAIVLVSWWRRAAQNNRSKIING